MYSQFQDPDFMPRYNEVMTRKWEDFEDYNNKLGYKLFNSYWVCFWIIESYVVILWYLYGCVKENMVK